MVLAGKLVGKQWTFLFWRERASVAFPFGKSSSSPFCSTSLHACHQTVKASYLATRNLGGASAVVTFIADPQKCVMSGFETPMPNPTPTTRAGRNAERRRQAAERARRYRERIAREGLPTAREIDQALSEALSFVSRRWVIVGGRPLIDFADVITVATLILKRSGKKKGPSRAAIRDRIEHRVEHTGPSWMPSTCPKPPELLLPPEGGNQWSEKDVGELLDVLGRHNVKRTPSRP